MALTISANVNGTQTENKNGQTVAVSYNDIYLDSSNNIAMAYDQEALLQQCAEASKTLLGELIFNTDIGIPYQEAVWIGVPNIQQFQASLRAAFLSIDGVTEVIGLETTQGGSNNPDTLAYTAIIKTIYGTGVLNG